MFMRYEESASRVRLVLPYYRLETRDDKVYRAAIHKLLEDGFVLSSEYQYHPYDVGERLKIEWKR